MTNTIGSGLSFPGLRVGDEERHACVELLNEHYLMGRLRLDELERRQQVALTATTLADLEGQLLDLPPDHDGPSPGPREKLRSNTTHLLPLEADNRAMATKAARLAVAPVAVGLAAWLSTSGIENAAALHAAFNASLVTGACGYLAAMLTKSRKK